MHNAKCQNTTYSSDQHILIKQVHFTSVHLLDTQDNFSHLFHFKITGMIPDDECYDAEIFSDFKLWWLFGDF